MKQLGKKKLLWIAGGIIALVVLIVVILLIYNAIFGGTSYENIENKLVDAAKEYYSENKELLPKNENEQLTISDSTLTSKNYLKSMSELTKKMDGVSCTGTVMVSYVNGNYRYTPTLDCGKDYRSQTFTSYLQENVNTVINGQGLYQLNNELIYRGEDPNNYVKFANKMWRIVKISDNNVVLILNEKYNKSVFDDRYNTERNRNDGINDYSVSRIYENLTNLYQKNELFNNETKTKLSSYTLYLGKRSENEAINDGSIEKSKVLENQYIGLLPLYDYINASIDLNCNSAITNSCSNYNYLADYGYNWWVQTADSITTYKVFRITSEGTVELTKANTNGYLRPVIHLATDVLYASGDGTLENPYIIK